MRKINSFRIFAYTFFITLIFTTFSSAIVINEFTVDPQTDWDESDSIGTGDEWIELFNPSNQTIDLTNWLLVMEDSTPSNQTLNRTLLPGRYLVILDPQGTVNNDGRISLYNNLGNLIDSVSFGNFNDTNRSDNSPNGNANDFFDECLSRIPNGADTNIDINDFVKTECTFGEENRIISPSEQNLEVTIAGAISFRVFPRNLDFGIVQPDSTNNNATNGPIILDTTGSSEDVRVEITEVTGQIFSSGLKIDGVLATNKIWTIFQSNPIIEAIPTLDVPENAQPGQSQGTIVYTVSGTP